MKNSQQSVRDRNQLLEAVNSEVKARLEQSLHNAVLTQILKQEQPQKLPRLWDVDVKIGKRPTVRLSPKLSLTQVFSQTGGKLLILGNQGSGKTTTILELARDLTELAQTDVDLPIPVLFNLSSWKDGKQTIADWMIAELKSRYGLNVKTGKQLVNTQQIFPLLDGIDELQLRQQELCIQAINQLIASENTPKNIVISTRLEDYKRCRTKLRLYGAIYLRPLAEPQIQQYLMFSRSRELWEIIKTEPDFLELAKTPLLLNMMILAYEEILIQAWKRITSDKERRDYLLNAYIRRMLTREIKSQSYPKGKEPRPEKTRPLLVFLAKRMEEANQSEFAIEQINPQWLQTRSQKWLYRFAILLTFGGIAGMKKFILHLIVGNYSRFLNYATERVILQRVGKRYRFVHELLQEHLAQM